jgi:hypothetical protein
MEKNKFERLLLLIEDLQNEIQFLFFKIDSVKNHLELLNRESANLTDIRNEIQKLASEQEKL